MFNHKTKLFHLLFSTLALTAIYALPPAFAEPQPPANKSFSLDLGGGLNTLSPYGSAKLSYTPETSPLAWFASIQGGPVFSPTNTGNIAFQGNLGGQFYFLQKGVFQPFIGASLGLNSSGTPKQAPLPNGRLGTIYEPALFGLVAIGSDIMFSDTFGLSFQISSDLGFLSNNVMSGTLRARPELNLKWKW